VDCINRGWDYQRVGGWRGLFPRLELQKGGYARSQRRTVIGLDHKTGPHTKEVWTGKYARLCSKALISYGYK
jgi:hypothetical protein